MYPYDSNLHVNSFSHIHIIKVSAMANNYVMKSNSLYEDKLPPTMASITYVFVVDVYHVYNKS